MRIQRISYAGMEEVYDLTVPESFNFLAEGIVTHNSIKVDNVGITKNLSLMEKEYASTLGKTVGSLTEAERRMAHYTGIIKEAKTFSGDHLKVMELLTGQISKLKTSVFNLRAAFGRALQPTLTIIVRYFAELAEKAQEWSKRNEELINEKLLRFLRVLSGVLKVIKSAIGGIISPFAKFVALFPNLTTYMITSFMVSKAFVPLFKNLGGALSIGKWMLFGEYLAFATKRLGFLKGTLKTIGGLFSAMTRSITFWTAALSTGLIIAKKLFDITQRERRQKLELLKVESKRLQSLREKAVLHEGDIRAELASVQSRIKLIGRTEELIKKEEELIAKLKEEMEVIKHRNAEMNRIDFERLKIEYSKLIDEMFGKKQKYVEPLPLGAVVKERIIPGTAGPAFESFLKNLDQIRKKQGENIAIEALASKVRKEHYDDIKKLVEAYFKWRKELERTIPEQERAKKSTEELNKEYKDQLGEYFKLLVQTRRNIALLKEEDEVNRKKLELMHQLADLTTEVWKMDKIGYNLKMDLIKKLQEEYDLRIKLAEAERKQLTFEQQIAQLGKEYRGAEAVARRMGGATTERIRLKIAEETQNKFLEIVRKGAEEGVLTEKQIRVMGAKNIEDLITKIRMGAEEERLRLQIRILEKERSFTSKIKLSIVGFHKAMVTTMERVSEGFFKSEVRRRQTLKKITSSLAFETLANILDALRMEAMERASLAAAAVVTGDIKKLPSLIKYSAYAGIAAGAAAAARSRAQEELTMTTPTSEDLVSKAEGRRSYGATTQLPPMNITIAPSVNIDSNGGDIIVSGGGVDILEREISTIAVEAIESAIRSGDIDITRIPNRR